MAMTGPYPSPYDQDPYRRERDFQREMERRYMEELERAQMQMAQPQWLSAPAVAPTPATLSGKTLLVVGQYMLKHEAPAFHLYRDTTKVVTWHACPTRDAIAAAMQWDRQMRPRVNAKDDFGYLLGVRFFKLSDDFRLMSPNQNTIWESNVLTAPAWDQAEVVRGKAGIHAAWPTRSGRVTPRIDHDMKDNLSLIATVRGFGKFVTGEMGWRAEKAIIDTVYLPSSLLGRWRVVKRLEKCYPAITFEEETWTLERSSRLAK